MNHDVLVFSATNSHTHQSWVVGKQGVTHQSWVVGKQGVTHHSWVVGKQGVTHCVRHYRYFDLLIT